jgi:agmatine deiminase
MLKTQLSKLSRRKLLYSSMLLSAGMFVETFSASSQQKNQGKEWFLPDESTPHKRTWMAFGASQKIWGKKLFPEVQRNLATIARTIAQYEPVSMLVKKNEYELARKLVGSSVELIVCPLDDLWMRDTGPVFVVNKRGEKAGISLNFNGWGNKQEFARDAQVADFIIDRVQVKKIQTNLVLEGGAIEVDGKGTAILTESCILNSNRNPGLSKSQCETQLKQLLGLEKIIWLPGIKGKDITDGHTDFYARFVRPGVVVAGSESDPNSFDRAVTQKHLEILKTAIDARGRSLEVVVLESPLNIRETYLNNDFAAGYINFYVCNGAVIAPEFGDLQADRAAKGKLEKLFPHRQIVQINIDAIAAGGGGIHCTTQQEP